MLKLILSIQDRRRRNKVVKDWVIEIGNDFLQPVHLLPCRINLGYIITTYVRLGSGHHMELIYEFSTLEFFYVKETRKFLFLHQSINEWNFKKSLDVHSTEYIEVAYFMLGSWLNSKFISVIERGFIPTPTHQPSLFLVLLPDHNISTKWVNVLYIALTFYHHFKSSYYWNEFPKANKIAR